MLSEAIQMPPITCVIQFIWKVLIHREAGTGGGGMEEYRLNRLKVPFGNGGNVLKLDRSDNQKML